MSALSTNPQEAPRPGWLFSPAIDLLLGCGLIYAVIVGLLFLAQPNLAQLGPWLPIIILLTGIPHYGATLARVSATAEDRRRYAWPLFLLTIVVAAFFITGLSAPRVGSMLITLYLTFSPWHYAAQNFGITMLFLRRREVPVSGPSRRLLRASFVTSFLLVGLSYHQIGAGAGNDPLYAASTAFRFLPLGIPLRFLRVATPVVFLLHMITLGMALRLLMKASRPRALTPALALIFSQSVWFSVPALVSLLLPGHYPGSQVALAFVWIAVGHCVQYLWISTYFHRQAVGNRNPTGWYLLRVTFIGAALWVVPGLLFAPGALGHVPFDAGLGLLIAAAVNLHHFALDGMIWRLREPRVGALLVNGTPANPTAMRSAVPMFARYALVAVGTLSVCVWIAAAWEREIGHHRAYAAKDVERLSRASQRLTAMGRDGPQIHIAMAKLRLHRGQLDEAVAEFQRSIDLQPTATAWRGLGRIYQQRGDFTNAEAAYRAAETIAIDAADSR